VPFHLREEGKSYTLKLTDEQVVFSLKERIEILENDNIRVLKELNTANDHIRELEAENTCLKNRLPSVEPSGRLSTNEEKKQEKLTPLAEYQERKRRVSQISSNTSSLKQAVERIQKLKELRKSLLKQPSKIDLS